MPQEVQICPACGLIQAPHPTDSSHFLCPACGIEFSSWNKNRRLLIDFPIRNNTRSRVISVRVYETDGAWCDSQAERLKMGVSDFVRGLIENAHAEASEDDNV